MRFENSPSGDIFVRDTMPFDSIDVQIAVDYIDEMMDTSVAEWPVLVEENNGVWSLCFVNPWPQEYLDFEELT